VDCPQARALLGRAQRYIDDLRAEVTLDVELDELRRMKSELESATSNVGDAIHENRCKHDTELNDVSNSGMSVSPSIADGDLDGDAGGKGGSP
jgi:sec-independent protein translocase protein TatB